MGRFAQLTLSKHGPNSSGFSARILNVFSGRIRRKSAQMTQTWLPVRQRVAFKIAVLVFQCLTGQAPAYLADDCQLTSDVSTRRLRSTDTAMCVVRRSNNSFGHRCFAAWTTPVEHVASPSTAVRQSRTVLTVAEDPSVRYLSSFLTAHQHILGYSVPFIHSVLFTV